MAKIIPLSEGAFTVDGPKTFIPFDEARDDLAARPRGSLLVEIQPFLLVTARDCILIDTGLGSRGADGRLQLYTLMEAEGIGPGQVTKVLLSHLHKDHSGGIATTDDGGDPVLSFPEATYYVNGEELKAALAQEGRSYVAEHLRALEGSPQLVLTGEEGDIDGYIRYQVSGGHSPHHQVFWIHDGDTCFFGGDVAPQLSYMKRRFMAKFDSDGRRSMELRQQYGEQGAREGWIFLFYHDIRTPFLRWGQEA